MRISDHVAAGGLVVVAADRVPVAPEPRITWAPFLGAPAPFPVGAYILASLLKCPTYLMFCLRQDDGYHVYYELFRESIHLPRRAREAELAELAGAYADRLASYCRRAPLQWFNFYDFWARPQAVRVSPPR
jgi:predicted LPLAT superfamily acyltransferase